jgi:hypothetical protein
MSILSGYSGASTVFTGTTRRSGAFSGTTRTTGGDALLASAGVERIRSDWNALINSKLIEWGRGPDLFDEDEIVPPTPTAIRAASTLSYLFRDEGSAAPDFFAPSGDGGIVVRWGTLGRYLESWEIDADGKIELFVTRELRVVRHDYLELVS